MDDPRGHEPTVLEVTLQAWTERWTGRLLGPARNQRRHVVRFLDGGVVNPAELTWLNGMAYQPGASFIRSAVEGVPDRKAVGRLLLGKSPRLLGEIDGRARLGLDRSWTGRLDELELDVELLLTLDGRPSLDEAETSLFPPAFEQLKALVVMGAVAVEQLEEVSISIDSSEDEAWERQEQGRQVAMARLAMEVGRWSEAEQALERAEQLGESAELHLERAWIILNTPRRDRHAGQREARRRLARALELDAQGELDQRSLDVMRLLVSRAGISHKRASTVG